MATSYAKDIKGLFTQRMPRGAKGWADSLQ
jgi:hypothetical protein